VPSRASQRQRSPTRRREAARAAVNPRSAPGPLEAVERKNWLTMDRLCFFDQCHTRVHIGAAHPGVDTQWLVPRDKDGKYDPENGEHGEALSRVKVKYAASIGANFGVAAPFVMDEDGNVHREGRQTSMLLYGQRTVVGPAKFEEHCVKEMAAARKRRGAGWKKFNQANPYKQRVAFEDKRDKVPESQRRKWKDVLREKVNKKYCDVCELIDHMYEQGCLIFEGTEAEGHWYIWCDGLASLWSKGALAYMEQKGIRDHFILPLGGISDDIEGSRKWAARMPGNRPEW
jgi:hypothetical protein